MGQKFSKGLQAKDVVVLEGDLGGGKTTFIKGILKGLGYKGAVLSPSFALMRQYKLRKLLIWHIDLYRLEYKDIPDLGIEEGLYKGRNITLIEWGDRIKKDLDKYIRVEFLFLGQNIRSLKFSTKNYGQNKAKRIERILG